MLGALAAMMTLLSPPAPTPQAPREFRAAWIATVDNIDWPSKPGLSSDQMKRELETLLDTCERLNFNAVVLQVRPSADALYKSDLEPWSWYLTGEQGKAPDDGFDPLAFACHEAHMRGLELHAWLNPYRALHPAQKGPVAWNHVSKLYPNAVKTYGAYEWMDPGDPEARAHSLAVFRDIVARYNIDGIHIDDYFYPYPVYDGINRRGFPDDDTYARYVANGGTLKQGDWRRNNVDTFIRDVYQSIKLMKPSVKFGISPFGIYRPDTPSGIKAGVDQYAYLYADCKLWLEQGWCDYMSPQLYWPIKQEAQSFPRLFKWWTSINPEHRHIWPGLFTSQMNPDGAKWKSKEIADQISLTRQGATTAGAVHFSVKAIQKNWGGIQAELGKIYKMRALVPSSPWLGVKAPAKPVLMAATTGSIQIRAVLGAQFVALYEKKGAIWTLRKVLPNHGKPIALTLVKGREIAVRGVSSTGIEGASTGGVVK
jgi:uncharacterized lipoprotein YddW (UPF0748 family)